MHIVVDWLNTSSSPIIDRTGLLPLCSWTPWAFLSGLLLLWTAAGISYLGRQFCCFLWPHPATEQGISLYCALTLPSGRSATCQLSFLSSVASLLLLHSHSDIFSVTPPQKIPAFLWPQLLTRPFCIFVSWDHIPGHSTNLWRADWNLESVCLGGPISPEVRPQEQVQ